jgi:FHA domain
VVAVGTLEKIDGAARHTLGGRCLVGRADHCALRIEHPSVSGEHALLRYRSERWYLRDLGSRNGTQVDDRPLAAGRETAVEPGSVFTFGSHQVRWRLSDASAPNLSATHGDGAVRHAADGLLVLPEDATPECALFADHAGWVLELGDARRVPTDQEVLDLPSGSWRLDVPSDNPLESTAISGSQPCRLQRARAIFRVSTDGEHVELDLQGMGWHRSLGARAHNDVLLALGRARLADTTERAQLPAADKGWVYGDELCRMADITPSALDLHVFRARQQLARAGIHNAGTIVERRPATKQLRLGLDDVTIASGDEPA